MTISGLLQLVLLCALCREIRSVHIGSNRNNVDDPLRANTELDYSTAVRVLSPALDGMARALQDEDASEDAVRTALAALKLEVDAALLYGHDRMGPLMHDCVDAVHSDRDGLEAFLKAQSIAEDRILQQRMAEMVELDRDMRAAKNIRPSLRKSFEASTVAERSLDDAIVRLGGASVARSKTVSDIEHGTVSAARSVLSSGGDDASDMSPRHKKYLREALKLHGEAIRPQHVFEEANEIRNALKTNGSGTALRTEAELNDHETREFIDVAKKRIESLRKFVSIHSALVSGYAEEELAKKGWDQTLQTICKPVVARLMGLRQVAAVVAGSLDEDSLSMTGTAADEDISHEVSLGHGLGETVLRCPNCRDADDALEDDTIEVGSNEEETASTGPIVGPFARFARGEQVQARRDGRWLPGDVTAAYQRSGVLTYDITFVDGKQGKHLPHHFLRIAPCWHCVALGDSVGSIAATFETSPESMQIAPWTLSSKTEGHRSAAVTTLDASDADMFPPVGTAVRIFRAPERVQRATLGPLGGSSSNLTVGGAVVVSDADPGLLHVSFDVRGYEDDVLALRFAARSGKSCASENHMDSHFYDSARMLTVARAENATSEDIADPWAAPLAAVDASDRNATGSFDISCGLSAVELEGRVVTVEGKDVHGQWHALACGVFQNAAKGRGSFSDRERCATIETMQQCKVERVPTSYAVTHHLRPMERGATCALESSSEKNESRMPWRERLGNFALRSVADAHDLTVEAWVYVDQPGRELTRLATERRVHLEQVDIAKHAKESVEQRARRLNLEAVVGAIVAGSVAESDVNPVTGLRDGSGPYRRGWSLSVEATPVPAFEADVLATESADGECVSSESWKDDAGSTCTDYEKYRWCHLEQPACVQDAVGCRGDGIVEDGAERKSGLASLLDKYRDLRLGLVTANAAVESYRYPDTNMSEAGAHNNALEVLEEYRRKANASRSAFERFVVSHNFSADGGYGAGWSREWGEFSDWVPAFRPSAAEACCACGASATIRRAREDRSRSESAIEDAPRSEPPPPQSVAVVWRVKGTAGAAKMSELRYSVPLYQNYVHLAGTYEASGGVLRLYVGGKLVRTETNVQAGAPLYLLDGQPPVAFWRPLTNDTSTSKSSKCAQGVVQDVRIWRTALRAEEIAGHAASSRVNSLDELEPFGCAIETSHPDDSEAWKEIRPVVPDSRADAVVASADEMDESMKKLIELAKISERKEADRADKVCRSLTFHYPFHNRPHRTSSTPISSEDILSDEWYFSKPRELLSGWGKSDAELLQDAAYERGVEQLSANNASVTRAKKMLDVARSTLGTLMRKKDALVDDLADNKIIMQHAVKRAREMDTKVADLKDELAEQKRGMASTSGDGDLAGIRKAMIRTLTQKLDAAERAQRANRSWQSKAVTAYHRTRATLNGVVTSMTEARGNVTSAKSGLERMKEKQQYEERAITDPVDREEWREQPWTKEGSNWDPLRGRAVASGDVEAYGVRGHA